MSDNKSDRDMPLVSVVITTYKRPANILVRAVRSVLDQTYLNVEVIIINDYPQEDSDVLGDAINELGDARVHYYVNEVNKGACYSRNRGASYANGEFLAFLDDDDTWKEDKIEKHLPFFEDADVGMVYAGIDIHSNGRVRHALPLIDDGSIYPLIMRRNYIGGCSVPVIRRKAFDQVGGFDERFPSAQDYDLWIRLGR
jgi:glycosyltransferase involved in cell wall biosynthesis